MSNDIEELKRRAGITEGGSFEDNMLRAAMNGSLTTDTMADAIAKQTNGDARQASRMTMDIISRMIGFPGVFAAFYHGKPKDRA